MNQYRDYREMECYQQARTLRLQVSELVKKLPEPEKFLLKSQIIKSSQSITANIAEGYGRYTYSDTRHFFMVARGSVTETMEHLTTAFDENDINEQELSLTGKLCGSVCKLIYGYIYYLDKSKNNNTAHPNS